MVHCAVVVLGISLGVWTGVTFAETPSAPAMQASSAPSQRGTVEGSIAAVNFKNSPPTLNVNTPNGEVHTIRFDSQATSIMKRGHALRPEDLQAG